MEQEEQPLLEIKTNDAESAAKIIVVGVGGAGNNAVNRMIEENIDAIAKRISALKNMNQNAVLYISAEKELKKISLEENVAILRRTIPL